MNVVWLESTMAAAALAKLEVWTRDLVFGRHACAGQAKFTTMEKKMVGLVLEYA